MSPSEQLGDLTNEPRESCFSSPVLEKSSVHETPPPRTQRLPHLDSSEAFLSEHTSIYDAEPVLSEKDESLNLYDSDDERLPKVPPSQAPQSGSSENIAPHSPKHQSPAETALQALNEHFNSVSQWRNAPLGTITERLERTTPTTSRPLLQAVSASNNADAGNLAAAKSELESTNFQARVRGALESCHLRSFSLNDLDCLKLREDRNALVQESSSSSWDALHAASPCESYPVQPPQQPPVRIPTPPGLPTFGTREAMEYRMPAPERLSWMPRWRTSRVGSEVPRSSTNPPVTDAVGAHPLTVADGLKRLLGISRIVSPIPEGPRRAAMPLYLARADDGTFVRGRFGTRHSAHGIGRGQLDTHPFHREVGESSRPRQSSLDRAVHEIDKACAESERQRTTFASLQVRSQSAPRGGNESPRHAQQVQRPLTIAEVLSQPPQLIVSVSPTVESRPPNQAVLSRPLLAFDQLGSAGSIRSQSTTTGIDGVRQFVEQGERISVEQNRQLAKQKEQRSGCANCWFAFCVCCCDMEDPDREVLNAGRVMSPEMGVSAVHSPNISPVRIVIEQPPRNAAARMIYRS